MNIFVTGASGFVGRQLCDTLRNRHQYCVSGAVRSLQLNQRGREFAIENIGPKTDWTRALAGIDVIIHTAARAHIMNDQSGNSLESYRHVNTLGTINLARQASRAGIKRFVFISSVKVNGESTNLGHAYQAEHAPTPEDDYGISKLEAEKGLLEISAATNMQVVIIRPPLVYGPGVKGNLASLFKLVKTGVPLPLGAIRNRRSLVAIDNLVDLILTCIDHPEAANQIFLAGDGRDFSTTELLRLTAKSMGKPSRLIPVPASLLMLGATILGKKAVAQRLLGSLQVDISKTREVLGWEPPVTVEEGLRRCFEFGE